MKTANQIWDESSKQVEVQVKDLLRYRVVSQSVSLPIYRATIGCRSVLKEING
jgi:hypothetical protein